MQKVWNGSEAVMIIKDAASESISEPFQSLNPLATRQ